MLPKVPIEAAFRRLTSGSYIERVVRLSDLASDFQLISNKGTVIRFQFVENVSMLGGLIKKKVPIVAQQTIHPHKRTLFYESEGDKGKVKVTKWRTFKATQDGGTLVSEIVDGECPGLYQPITKREGKKALIAAMNKYPTLFNDFYK
ncbi:unnamed protein product [Adineta steineri]|uniref:Uncharacterized protein n=1 Tax=Adineta steineri TaxID=433720 RepID=A0A818WPF7_9BILA|nr:unnamed protein product [Adineta steineri]CAF1421051.1 unnamed protein product [Adineta steineri]CAF3728530.1 unnamed protein product [Adineta steineri]CAF3860325.1 unnamed protein product [Adineta steineri]